jgi:hypothetical protein
MDISIVREEERRASPDIEEMVDIVCHFLNIV